MVALVCLRKQNYQTLSRDFIFIALIFIYLCDFNYICTHVCTHFELAHIRNAKVVGSTPAFGTKTQLNHYFVRIFLFLDLIIALPYYKKGNRKHESARAIAAQNGRNAKCFKDTCTERW